MFLHGRIIFSQSLRLLITLKVCFQDNFAVALSFCLILHIFLKCLVICGSYLKANWMLWIGLGFNFWDSSQIQVIWLLSALLFYWGILWYSPSPSHPPPFPAASGPSLPGQIHQKSLSTLLPEGWKNAKNWLPVFGIPVKENSWGFWTSKVLYFLHAMPVEYKDHLFLCTSDKLQFSARNGFLFINTEELGV